MKLYFKFKNIPELASLTPGQRQEVWSRTAVLAYRDPATMWGLVGYMLFVGVGSYLGDLFLTWRHGYMLGPFLFHPIGMAVWWQLAVRRMRPQLAKTRAELLGD